MLLSGGVERQIIFGQKGASMDIGAWLRSLNLEQYAAVFQDNGVDTEILPELTEADLEKLGVLLGHRKRLLKAISALRDEQRLKPEHQHVAGTKSPAEAERRQLTVMFCDLVGSTALSARLDPEDMRDVIRAYQTSATDCVARSGGFIAKYMGDGILVYFGYPQAHEDDAERAIRAGLDLIDAVTRLGKAELLQARIGIATGLVVVGDLIGSGASQEQSVVGETPNLAARLQAAAKPNTVVVDSTTHRLAGGLFEYDELPAQDAIGFEKPIHAWRIIRASSRGSRFEALRSWQTPLIGRDKELEILLQCWHQCRQDQGLAVLMVGEAGLGKSRLVVALQPTIEPEGRRLQFFCSPQHCETALYPVRKWLEQSADFTQCDTPAGKVEKLNAVLANGSPPPLELALIAELLGLSSGDHTVSTLGAKRRKDLTFSALIRQFSALAERQPIFMLWEDVHWADATSLEFLDRLVERIHQLPALLVITARPEFRAPWTRKPQVKLLKLRRLSRHQNTALIESVAGKTVLAGELLDQLLYRADGIPLFAEELTKAVLESGSGLNPGMLDRDHGENTRPLITVPATLHGALSERLDRYPAAKKLAQVGSVVGREFSYALLKSITEKTTGELDEGLAQLVASGVVLTAGPRPDAMYTFKHALLQEAAYDSLLKGQRKALHAAIADYLCAFAERPVPEVIARHYTAGGMYEKAAHWWRDAGDLARQQGAYWQTVACYRRTIDLLRALPPSQASKQAELDCCIAMALPLTAVSDRRSEEARQTATRAVELSEELGARDRMVEAHYGLYLNLYNTAHLDSALETASRLSSLAQEGRNREPHLIADRALGTCLFSLGRFEEAMVHLRSAAAEILEQKYSAARPFPIKHANLISAAYLVWALIISGKPGESAAALKLLQDILDGPEDFPTGRAVVHWNLATAYFCGGDRDAVRYHSEKAIQCLQRIEIPEYAAPPKILRMWAAPEAGSSVWSDAHSARTYLRAQRIEAGTYLEAPVVFAVAALSLREAGNPSAAAELLVEALETARSTNERWFEAELLRLSVDTGLRAGSLDPDKAAELLVEATRIAGEQGAKLFELRSASDLLSLWREDRRRADAYTLLAAVYGQYTDGFDLPDLTKAQSLLRG